MISVYLLLLLTVYQTRAKVDDYENVTQSTELKFAFMIFRHGDRAPMGRRQLVVPSKKLLRLIEAWGFGQLTTVGKQTSYDVGRYIRRRYNQLLSPQYNKSEIYIRSTDSTRAKMSVLLAMAAVYPAVGDTWSQEIKWEPVPYTTVPARYDFNTAHVNCPEFVIFQNYIETEKSKRMEQYSEVLAKVSCITKFNVTATPILSYSIYDLFLSEHNLGYDLGERLNSLMPSFEHAAGEAMDIVYGDDNYIALQAGVLLNEFFTYANQIIHGTDTQRVRVYSGHDFNVYSLESVSHVNPRQGYPDFGSVFSLELRKVSETGKFVVVPVYLPSPDETEVYLNIEGCGFPCGYEKFLEICSNYLLDVDTWRKKCGYMEDYEIDTWRID